jgi:hypothetical protein
MNINPNLKYIKKDEKQSNQLKIIFEIEFA